MVSDINITVPEFGPERALAKGRVDPQTGPASNRREIFARDHQTR